MISRLSGALMLPAIFLSLLFFSIPSSGGDDRSHSGLSTVSGRKGLTFIENRGQFPPEVKFSLQGGEASVYFGRTFVSYCLQPNGTEVRVCFSGAGSSCSLKGTCKFASIANYLKDRDPSRWITSVPTYESVIYQDIWPGVDVIYRGMNGRLKYDIRVEPGVSIECVKLRYEGIEGLSINSKGELEIDTPAGTFTERVPAVYQNNGGKKVLVKGKYRLIDQDTVGFSVENRDESRELVIDPEMGLGWSVVFGGWSDFENVNAVAVGPDGSVYLTGETASYDFPVTAGTLDTAYDNDYRDAFVMKMDANGLPVYCTFLGGSGSYTRDVAYGIAVDSSGSAYVAGFTDSPMFPTTPGAFDTVYGDTWGHGGDAFVAKLAPDGTALVYSTLLGGSNGWDGDKAYAVAVDASGCAYVGGVTESSDFPTTPGAFDTMLEGCNRDGFITKLNAAGSQIVYSTFIGGSDGFDSIYSLTVDNLGYVYAGGQTRANDFPVTPGAYDVNSAGGGEGFLVKLYPDGSSLSFSTFVGGSGNDSIRSIAVDTSGCVYAAGKSNSQDFPAFYPAYDTTSNGDNDAFVLKLNAAGNTLIYATYLGGKSDDQALGLAVDVAGSAYVVGSTKSSNFPATPGSYDTSFNGDQDAFIAKLNPNGSGLIYSTFMGGNEWDEASAISVPALGAVYVVGQTDSYSFPVSRVLPGPTRSSRDMFLCSLGTSAVLVIGSSPGGNTNPPPGGYVYPPGTIVPLTASPVDGYVFERWDGPVTNPASPSTSVTIDVSKYVVPIFIASSDRLGGIIRLPDGAWVIIPTKPVTALFSDGFYMEELDRSAGVKVIWPTAFSDTAAAVYGMVTTIGPERVIQASTVIPGGQYILQPLGMPNRSIGGHLDYPVNTGFWDTYGPNALYNIGLLVRTTGKVTYLDQLGKFAYIDDGSGILDSNTLGSGDQTVPGVRLELPSGVRVPNEGQIVAASGISSWTEINGLPARLIRLRSRSDISLLSGAMITGRVVDKYNQTMSQIIESAHPYADNYTATWTVTGPTNTTRVRPHFSQVELEGGFDYLSLCNSNGDVYYSYTYGVQTDVWGDWIDGGSMLLKLRTDGSTHFYGFRMDRYEAEITNPVPGITLTLTPGSKTIQTGIDGHYTFSGLSAGTYTLTPSQPGRTFTPANVRMTIGDGEYVPDVNFVRN